MSDRLPPNSRLSRYFDPASAVDDDWFFPEEPATALGTIDFDAIPTVEERAADPEAGPQISLIDEPHAIALPDAYEPGYAYPLIVWFHGTDGTEDEVFDVLPQISERNYLALAIRGNLPTEAGARWASSVEGVVALARKIEQTVSRMQQSFNVHPQRIYLAGRGTGGTTALELLLAQPEKFAGAAAFQSEFPQLDAPLAQFRGLRGRRMLLTTTFDCAEVKVGELVAAGRKFYSAGMQVGTRVYQQTGDAAETKMFRDLDRWIMDGIATAITV
jgi:phospholipase/carboxylesterase